MEEHVASGNRLVATSTSYCSARGLAIKNEGSIYQVADPGSGEVAVYYKRIAPEDVMGAWILGAYGKPDRWIANPNYVPR
ncbi:hypothetical protein MTP10_30600 [Nonomuraea sp. 3-1Str]|uniref:hypothetical protein n=1 Tax=Nonomuraea sp. 3-1Str TaxID=2929801 RepID=UPI00285DEC3A|nr:hypothetical protein [Nonomuraea sp. 3-1Str]MDR8413070.1 hypothetical protein [Nonomuraea sp. 3-1Str]